jgi:hypothetical protein
MWSNLGEKRAGVSSQSHCVESTSLWKTLKAFHKPDTLNSHHHHTCQGLLRVNYAQALRKCLTMDYVIYCFRQLHGTNTCIHIGKKQAQMCKVMLCNYRSTIWTQSLRLQYLMALCHIPSRGTWKKRQWGLWWVEDMAQRRGPLFHMRKCTMPG